MSNLHKADDLFRFGAYDSLTRAEIFWRYVWPFLHDKKLKFRVLGIPVSLSFAKAEPALRALFPLPSPPTTA